MPHSLIFIAFVSLALLVAWALDPHRAAWSEHRARLMAKRRLQKSVLAWKECPRRWKWPNK